MLVACASDLLVLPSCLTGSVLIQIELYFSKYNLQRLKRLIGSISLHNSKPLIRRHFRGQMIVVLTRLHCNFTSFLQSETCEVRIPWLDFQSAAGTLGGRFTTLEGLLCNVKDQVPELLLVKYIFYRL